MVVLSKTNTDKICFSSSSSKSSLLTKSTTSTTTTTAGTATTNKETVQPKDSTTTTTIKKEEEEIKRTILETIQLNLYRYNLWTGLYMLEPKERIAINALFGFLFFIWFWYTNMFLRGFLDGWQEGVQTSST